MNFLKRFFVKATELHAHPVICIRCGTFVFPKAEEERSIIDCLFYPPSRCPKCRGEMRLICPDCKKPLAMFPKIKNFREAFLGGQTCKHCGCVVDKWGRKRKKASEIESPDN
jgi:hypothetical protein